MLRIIQNFVLVMFLGSLLLLSGCASNQTLKQPIARNSRVGVIANFRTVALFQRAGTTSVDNSSFYRRLPRFNMNALVTAAVTRGLYRSRKFKVIPIYHRTASALLTARVEKSSRLSPEYQDYLSKITRRHKLDTIVLITPGDIDFGNGQYFGSIWWASGYGLFNRAFVFMQTNTVFAAYNVYIVNAKTYRVLAMATGDLQSRSHDINITWHRGFAGVSQKTLTVIRSVLQKKVPSSITSVVRKTGII